MSSKCVVTSFHNYVPMYDKKYFNVLSDYFLHNFHKYWIGEVDCLYILDSGWDLKVSNPKIKVIKTNPNLRYWEAYKKVLPEIKEDLVLFMDNDMVVYRSGMIREVFRRLDAYGARPFDVVSIYDTIGKKHFAELGGQSKFCLYWFATRKDLLMKYLDVDWGPNLPEHETLGKLTEEMLKDGVRPYEWPEDKTSIYLQKGKIVKDGEGKNLGFYHIRSGSVPAYLLTHRNYGNRKTYDDYLRDSPKREYLRQSCWFQYMGGDSSDIIKDSGVNKKDWDNYYLKFRKFHGLI